MIYLSSQKQFMKSQDDSYNIYRTIESCLGLVENNYIVVSSWKAMN